MKKITSLLLIIALVFSFAACKKGDGDSPATTVAVTNAPEVTQPAEPEIITSGDWQYKAVDGKATVVKYSGSETALSIPASFDNAAVTTIGTEAFKNNDKLSSLVIPETVTTIESHAFDGCTNLLTINIPAAVAAIENHAFTNTAWLGSQTDEFVIVGDSVLIGYHGNAESVSIPDGVKYVSDAMRGIKTIKSITLPATVSVIGPWAFTLCASLESISIPDSVVYIGARAFSHCKALASLTIPASVAGTGDSLFFSCGDKLTSVTFLNDAVVLGADLFFNCENITVSCRKGSNAEKYALDNSINSNIIQ